MALTTERQKVAHLLRRFGLGASEAELTYYAENGLSGAIDRLFDYQDRAEPFAPEFNDLNPNGNAGGNPRFAQIYWYAEFLTTERPLEKKLALFWHDHFAVSAQKVSAGTAMQDHSRILMEHATGNYKNLLEAVSKDPAMLYWLDNQENVKGSPNENFAREVLELFTMGVDNGYTEEDVQETARAFTGWTIGVRRRNRVVPVRQQLPRLNTTYYFDRRNHDTGTKKILGNVGEWTGEEALGMIASKSQTAEYLATKMWEWFAYPKPEKAIVERLAKKFRDSGLEISALVRGIMESEEFYSDKAERAILKNPVDFVIPVLRQVGIGQVMAENASQISEQPNRRRAIGPAQIAIQATTAMGMELMYPPDVAGWEGGYSWVSTATMVERIKWSDRLWGGARGVQSLRFPAFSLVQDDLSPEGMVNRMMSLFDVELPDEKVETMVSAAREVGDRATARNANRMAHAVCRLMFGSPEFQFA